MSIRSELRQCKNCQYLVNLYSWGHGCKAPDSYPIEKCNGINEKDTKKIH